MIDVRMAYNPIQAKDDKMWISGWKLAKYEEIQLLPETEQEIAEWFYGFTMGTVEAVLYDYLNDRLEYLLHDYQGVLASIQRWRGQNSPSDDSGLLH